MENIESLTSKIQGMIGSLSGWNSTVTVIMALTAFLGVLYFVTTIFARHKAEDLSKAKDELILLKDQESKKEVARLNLATEEARVNAARANTETEKLARDNIKLRSELEKTISDANIEKQKMAKMQIEVANARRQQAEAERSLEELRERIRPRSFTTEQQNRLIEKLKTSIKGPVDIKSILGDAESFMFASEIDNLLKVAGWVTRGISHRLYEAKPSVGIHIVVRNGQSPPRYAAFLQQAFDSIGVRLDAQENPNVSPDIVELVVGIKPEK